MYFSCSYINLNKYINLKFLKLYELKILLSGVLEYYKKLAIIIKIFFACR